ncbi:MAG: twin-arginine translocation pathway signal [Cypionkella sp.]|uniref:lipid-binding SYLF domain-containing protein n=1 Tax=Cypionkella sp. TaxID=2811411 RepID=UPI00262EBC7D|nr:YSC84-related protein [Cypionkella sp.]MDB5660839.1 twin-arginine translocation pathway signal [Cypionkella sp.]
MTEFSRRGFMALGAVGLVSACQNTVMGNGVGSNGAAQIDARVRETQMYLFNNFPGTKQLASRASGILTMPLVTEAGFGFGGAYGRGVLQIAGTTVDYYSATKASIGFQIGAQQYAHMLFFTTDAALQDFRRSPGWAASADIRYATPDEGGSIGKETTELDPVIAFVFGQQGLMAGATLSGVKYTRIIV